MKKKPKARAGKGHPAPPTRWLGLTAWEAAWLVVLLALGAFLRFYSLGTPPNTYWMDMATETADARNSAEMGMHHWLFPVGTREPFFNYFTAGIWLLLPEASGVLVQRLSTGLLDLSSLVLFFLLGRELGGTRVGLLLCALGAVCRPMVIQCVLGMRIPTTVLGVALALLATVRLVKAPSQGRFLLWGLAVAFNGYTYTAARPWIPFLILAVLAWLALRRQERSSPAFFPAVLLGLWGTAFFLSMNHQWPAGLRPFFPGKWFLGVGLLVLLLAVEGWRAHRLKRSSLLSGWLWAFALVAAVQAPLLRHPLYSIRFRGLELFQEPTGLGERVQVLLQQARITLESLFKGGHDRGDLNLFGQAFLDPWILAIVLLGLALPLVRPSARTWLLFASIPVGLASHLLSKDPHSGKLMGCLVPLLCLGALAVEALWKELEKRVPAPVPVAGAVLFLLGAAAGCFQDVWRDFPRQYYPDRIAALAAAKEAGTGPVFLAMDQRAALIFQTTESVLNDGKDVRKLLPNNPLYVTGQEAIEKVVVIFPPGADPDFEKRLKREYPSVAWDLLPWPEDILPQWKPQEGTSPLRKVAIPLDLIRPFPGGLFSRVEVPPGGWDRRVFLGHYGFGHGVLLYRDLVQDPGAPLPADARGRTLRLSGKMDCPKARKAVFALSSQNPVMLRVDGRRVLRLKEGGRGEEALPLAAGAHSLELTVTLSKGFQPPSLTVQ